MGKLVGRFREGDRTSPEGRAGDPPSDPDQVEDAIVALRKELADVGLDAGA